MEFPLRKPWSLLHFSLKISDYAHKGLHYAHSLYHKEGPDEIGTNKEERVSDVPINESERVTE
jgi:hypothetical protein